MMAKPHLSIRELQIDDISLIADYWLLSDPNYMKSMGVDLAKLPVSEVKASNCQHSPVRCWGGGVRRFSKSQQQGQACCAPPERQIEEGGPHHMV